MDEATNSLAQIVGRNIHTRRKFLEISQEVLAERVGIGQQSLSRMEQGKIAPKFERLQQFADALECRVADLFLGTDIAKDAHAKYLADLLHPLTTTQRAFVLEQILHLTRFLASNMK